MTVILIQSLEYYLEMGYVVKQRDNFDKDKRQITNSDFFKIDKTKLSKEGLVVKFKMAAFNDNHLSWLLT